MSGDIYNSASLLVGANQASASPPLPVTSMTDGAAQRLQVEAIPSGGTLPSQVAWGTQAGARTIWTPLTNNGSANLLVNGTAAAPVVFSLPAQAKQLTITMVKFIASVTSYNYTGNQITATAGLLGAGVNTKALPNGILLNTVSSGVTSNLMKIQIIEDFFSMNGDSFVYAGTQNYLIMAYMLFNQILVAGSTTDAIQVAIQDQMVNVSTIVYLRAFAGGTRAA